MKSVFSIKDQFLYDGLDFEET